MCHPDGTYGRAQSAQCVRGTELSIVVPTFNEAENVGALVRRSPGRFAGVEWEIIFVDDDSPDGTADVSTRTVS